MGMMDVSRAEYFEAIGVGIGFCALQIAMFWLVERIMKESRCMKISKPRPVPLIPEKDPRKPPVQNPLEIVEPLKPLEKVIKEDWWKMSVNPKPLEFFNKIDGMLESAKGVPYVVPGDFVRKLMAVLSKMEVTWRGVEFHDSNGLPFWTKQVANHCAGNFDEFSNPHMVVLTSFRIKNIDSTSDYAENISDYRGQNHLVFIPIMIMKYLHEQPDLKYPKHASQIRARMIYVGKVNDDSGFPSKHYVIVMFSTVKDFRNILEDVGSLLKDDEGAYIDTFKDPLSSRDYVSVTDYRCTQDDDSEIVLEALRWTQQEALSVLGISE